VVITTCELIGMSRRLATYDEQLSTLNDTGVRAGGCRESAQVSKR